MIARMIAIKRVTQNHAHPNSGQELYALIQPYNLLSRESDDPTHRGWLSR